MSFESIGRFIGGLITGAAGGVVGTVGGGVAGALAGGATGAVLGAPTGPGEIVTIPAGAVLGGVAGGVYGGQWGAKTGSAAGSETGGNIGAWIDNQILEARKADDKAKEKDKTGTVTTACSNCKLPPECSNLLQSMKDKMKKFKQEDQKYAPEDDALGGHSFMAGGKLRYTKPGGHYTEMRDLQRGIKNDLRRYAALECYKNASSDDKTTRKAAEQTVSYQVEVPPGIDFIPL